MRRLLTLIIVACTLAVASAPAWATSVLMEELPTTSRFRCLNCHAIQDPEISQAELNPFGQAFANNGFKWDETLARERSDGDNCANGFELGDVDGDGELDAGIEQERSNPGEAGCTLQLDERTWGRLKELFR